MEKKLLNIDNEKFVFNLDKFLKYLNYIIPKKQSIIALSINLHAMYLIENNRYFYNIYNNANKIFFDGNSSILLARLTGYKKIDKISHDILMKKLYKESINNKWSIYFLGGSQYASKRIKYKINQYFPKLNIAGSHHGYFKKIDEQRIIDNINDISPDILAVGLGMPKQEKWINNNKHKLNVGMITNCGGYIEQTVNKGINYYPEWVYKYNLNWLYRIYKEPKTLWKRYFIESLWYLWWLPYQIIKNRIIDKK